MTAEHIEYHNENKSTTLDLLLREAGCYNCGKKIGGTGRPIILIPDMNRGTPYVGEEGRFISAGTIGCRAYCMDCLILYGVNR